MQIVVLNPNSSEKVTEVIMAAARRAAPPGTTLIGVTPRGGTRNVDSAFGDYMSGRLAIQSALEAVERHHPDGLVLAGFGNVGIFALKEALDIPVVSIAEASMALASLLGHRFTTLTMLKQFIPYQQDLVRLYGFEAKCASVRAININVEECAVNRDKTLRELSDEIVRVVREDQSEVVILACAGLCGYERELSKLAGVPVLDPVAVGVRTAEAIIGLGVAQSKVRKFAHPPQRLEDYV